MDLKERFRHFWIAPILLLTCATLSACTPTDEDVFVQEVPERPEDPEKDTNNDNSNENMESKTIRLTVDDRTFTATLEKNSSAEALITRLSEGNIQIRMDDYGNMEKVGSLGFSLPRNDRQTTTSPGDLILYQGNSFVIYYDSNSWNFTCLGHVDGVTTRKQMLELLGGEGEITITLSLE